MPLKDIVDLVQAIATVVAAGWAIYLFKVSQEIQRAQIYKDLEFKAIDVMLKRVEKKELSMLYDPDANIRLDQPESKSIVEYGYCVLNLLELMFGLQKKHMLPEGSFVTWLPWCWEFSRGGCAAKLWREQARQHYSSDFADLMD